MVNSISILIAISCISIFLSWNSEAAAINKSQELANQLSILNRLRRSIAEQKFVKKQVDNFKENALKVIEEAFVNGSEKQQKKYNRCVSHYRRENPKKASMAYAHCFKRMSSS